ncbi:hypothetical protein TNIN_33521 [Trichonephila inaurata madagascariensis]|uniref:Secreted protein n=1 Tax=Trichonephila inaurata madagascariensis TaxID=2747483 RepID=A0A8X6WQM2_9ARAC|nr:hypothetical protein TNIN_33521 [Trichonephila inaurata madagascariensis]
MDPSCLIALMQVLILFFSTTLWVEEDLYNRVSHKSLKNAILNLRNVPRSRVVAEFRLASGHMTACENICIDSRLFLPRNTFRAALKRSRTAHIYIVLLCARRFPLSVTER